MTPNDRGDEVETAIAEVNRQRRRKTLYLILASTCPWISIIALLALRAGAQPLTGLPGDVLGGLFGLVLCGPIALPAFVALGWTGDRRALEALGALDDIRALGPLLRARQEICGQKTKSLLDRSASRILDHISEHDRGLLTAADLRLLNGCMDGSSGRLSQSPHPLYCLEFTFSANRALVHVGDATSLRYVEHLARIEPRSPEIAALARAAQECATTLRERLAEEQPSVSLLRPAADEPDTLLRPATSSMPTVSDDLLRPAASSD